MPTIRFCVISDTHDTHFPYPLPHYDVLLHCGDLTQIGGLSACKRAIQALKDADANLKLVIARNHDVSLDVEWGAQKLVEVEDDPDEARQSLELFRSHDAKEAGLRYLKEGTHTLELNSGVRFTHSICESVHA